MVEARGQSSEAEVVAAWVGPCSKDGVEAKYLMSHRKSPRALIWDHLTLK